MSMMLVNCSGCRTTLQVPPGAPSIRCSVCSRVLSIATRSAPAPYPPQQSSIQSFQPPMHPQYAPTPPHPGGQKKAVIVGICYRSTRYELKGCINDANCMKYMLLNRFQFPESSILMLTEDERDPLKRPTRHNIRMALYWLVLGCKPGDSLVFHFSGHGAQQRNTFGDEKDGMDETICPVDFEVNGMIVDDQINEAIVRPLGPGVRLHAIIDACHSGTVLDLPWFCRMDRQGQWAWEDHRSSRVYKGTNGGEAYSFSGCDDGQTSADTSALAKSASTGAMTFSFIQAVERREAMTYAGLLSSMRNSIRRANSGSRGVTDLIGMLLSGGSFPGGALTQEPQLTSANCFDINSRFHL
ncbi:metacaspase-1 [Marchantia polymorpha subsp. ruderalis]|uniref:Uncharacterized protein n=2 Tax=Marchantia polymorpha TaxID=3197 RepID=A0AAF6C0M8_MARPO|nr:hypothetical protein MARPO_0051s0042 [Marchantia polymorpha]BBN17812.1 hypothetical protein Mp_7g17040 [Marchantia polymorpha subsp. ruderalis]|eukprot:PTQ38438.1 hypothetical protein MARPO_0051s0042 [Marchantia polymorpha]